jgi:cytoskeletal protein CcmA (bactofilin family)/predicted Zn-ribbon and HTH transcriptional regulator
MAEPRKTDVVDGFTVVRMVKHAKDSGVEPAKKAAPEASAQKPPERPQPVRHIGKTVQPTKRPIRCYECGYDFHLTVRVAKTYCPKCRASLELTDHTIEAEWHQDLKTAGQVHVMPGGCIKQGHVIGQEVILEGKIEGGTVEAYGILEVRSGADFSEGQVKSRHLRVGAGVELCWKQKTMLHDVEIFGTLDAELEVSGRLEIKAGGHLRGRVNSRHLMVEDGGGLTARVFIWPQGPGAPHES